MKKCPQCQSTFTDDTLQFCLQDGSPLEITADEKTLVLGRDSVADEKTIIRNTVQTSPDDPDKTRVLSNRETVAESEFENLSRETVIRQNLPVGEPVSAGGSGQTSKKSGLGFLTGCLVGVLLIGAVGAVVLGIIFLPGIVRWKGGGDGNSNINAKTPPPVRDSKLVRVSASSTRKPEKGNHYDPELAFDGNSRTAWAEGVKGPGRGQWIIFDFQQEVNLKAIKILPGYFKTAELWRKNNRLASAVFKFSNGRTRTFEFPDEMKEQKLNVGSVKTTSVMISIKDFYRGQADSEDTLISEVSFIVE